MLVKSLVLGIMLSLGATTALAQNPDDDPLSGLDEAATGLQDGPMVYERYRLPEGRRCHPNGYTFQCFTLGEYKILLEMDSDLQFLEPAYDNALSRIDVLEKKVVQLEISLAAANSQIVILEEERDRLHGLWAEENRKRLEAENRPMLGSWVAWALAAAEAVALGTVFVVLAVD